MTRITKASVGTGTAAALAIAALLAVCAPPVGATGDTGRRSVGTVAAKVNANGCRSLTTQKAAVHTAAVNREATLARLVSTLQVRRDPWSLNAGQIGALQSASSGITALDRQIQSTCYATIADFRADATKLFSDDRVYWLRVPQTHGIEAADWLADARTRLGAVAVKLASHVGTSTQAKTDLAAMNRALATADSKLGTPPNPAPDIAQLPKLAPAVDMTADVAAMEAARSDLRAARAALVEARADALKVIADLRV